MIIPLPTRLRKVRKFRGSRTHGWGQVGQHRKSGQRGGKGKAGLHKHKWTWTVKYAPDHFSRDAFKPPRRNLVRKWINVGELDSWAKLRHLPIEGGRKVLDLTTEGFEKLLGSGEVKGSYKVLIPKASALAIEKVEAAGGEVVAS